MTYKIDTTEIDFEAFLSIFYALSAGMDDRHEPRFLNVIDLLERRLQDLDSSDKNHVKIRQLLSVKLKYWASILSNLPIIFNERRGGKELLLNALIYNLERLSMIAEKVMNQPYLNLEEEVSEIRPHPDEHFKDASGSEDEKTNISLHILLIKQFLDNYVDDQLLQHHRNMTPKEEYFYDLLQENIIYGGYFEGTFDKYIIDQIAGTNEVTELPVSIYLDTNDPQQIDTYYHAVSDFLKTIHCDFLFEYPPKPGSWWRRAISSTKKIMTSDELTERLKKIEHGIEVNTIQKTQSEIDKNQAEAFAAILNSSTAIPRIATLIGSLLIVKTTDVNGEATVYSRTLTTNEMIYLQKNPHLLTQPATILEELGKNSSLPSPSGNLIE